ncbi:flagellar hook-associated protein FlgK [Gracilibacillus sp. D59]|uniref:flagellar hook-associated protein FlgK n=1 Tax=Gracilibacillus sp. D59 TaxID=3457434 RepID=UPI003FCCDE14
MSSTFNGLEVAKRALHTQQAALYTTGHNIANANTEGYTRQRVNMTQTAPYPPASRNRPEIPGQVGSGVEAGSIERIRDSFIDKQYRQENTKVGFYQTKADMMSKMESILNEPSEEGLSKSFDQFWQSLQDLSVNPEDSGARSVVKERGIALSETLNYVHNSLQEVRTNFKNEIDVDNTQVNSLIDQINQLNGQIAKIEPHGYVPNDLYDKRDKLIDELSEYVDIKVDYRESSGDPSPIAQGLATIKLNTDNITVNGTGGNIILVNGQKGGPELGSKDAVNHMFVDFDDNNNVNAVFFAKPNTDETKDTDEYVQDLVNNFNNEAFIYGKNYNINGKMDALIDGAGYNIGTSFQYDASGTPVEATDGTAAGEINKLLQDLDKLTENFVREFNAVHRQGYTLEDTPQTGLNFFTGAKASTIKVNDDIQNNVNLIAASSSGASGDGENAIALADVYTKRAEEYLVNADPPTFDPTIPDKASVKSYYEGIIGELGVQTQESIRMQGNSEVLRQQVDESRQAISSVSLDEEMTNLIKYQHAYNAAARNMTAVDEMLDRVINNMGLVGR